MVRGRGHWRNEPLPVAEVWKPDVCEEEGCTERHPSFSRDGMKGPWRCKAHDATAVKQSDHLAPLAAEPDARLI